MYVCVRARVCMCSCASACTRACLKPCEKWANGSTPFYRRFSLRIARLDLLCNRELAWQRAVDSLASVPLSDHQRVCVLGLRSEACVRAREHKAGTQILTEAERRLQWLASEQRLAWLDSLTANAAPAHTPAPAAKSAAANKRKTAAPKGSVSVPAHEEHRENLSSGEY